MNDSDDTMDWRPCDHVLFANPFFLILVKLYLSYKKEDKSLSISVNQTGK